MSALAAHDNLESLEAEALDLSAKPVDAADRLSFTLFLAIVVHMLLILGVGFKLPDTSTGSQTIEITLATHKSLKAPDQADFIAQHNQEGSGTLDTAKQLSTQRQALFSDNQIRDIKPLPQMAAAAPTQDKNQRVLTTIGKSPLSTYIPDQRDQPDDLKAHQGLLQNQTLIDPEIASLQAKLDQLKQDYAKRPRVRTLTSVSAKESYDAQYLYNWGQKIEITGNAHYPQEALTQHITGSLRMSVVINPDGTIYQVELLQSSGTRVLDDAARQIVRLAAPFAKFPPEIRKQSDRLQIIRTWNFEITGLRTSAQ